MHKSRLKAASLGILCILLAGCTSVSFVLPQSSEGDVSQQRKTAGAVALLELRPNLANACGGYIDSGADSCRIKSDATVNYGTQPDAAAVSKGLLGSPSLRT